MEYKKYKWFYTSNDKLVVAGKSAENNDKLLKEILETGKDYWVCHTSHPGSPFSVIIGRAGKKDLEECAIFTGCFSKAWKQGKKNTEIHLFKASQLSKRKGMKTGTWQVKGKVEKRKVDLRLVLVKQKKILRAVPKGKGMAVYPGNVDKGKMADKIIKELKMKVSKNDVMAALPAGGVRI